MKKYLVRRFNEIFNPSQFQQLDVYGVLSALQDQMVLKKWLYEVLQEIKNLNMSIDRGLVSGKLYDINDLSAKRKALQGILESALSIHREVRRGPRPNPSKGEEYDLENVTFRPSV